MTIFHNKLQLTCKASVASSSYSSEEGEEEVSEEAGEEFSGMEAL